MSSRTHAASWAAALLVLALTGCATVQETLDRLAISAVTGTSMDSFDQVDRDEPFAGTPAEDFAEGFDTPEASAAGRFEEEAVDEAYAATKELLEAVYLNEDAVFGEDNSEFTELLTGQALEWYLDNLGRGAPDLDSRSLAFNLTPGTAEPIGDIVKVDGRMWAERTRDDYRTEYLAVHTEYTIVHPIARPGDPVSVRLVTSHFGEVAFYEVEGGWEAWPSWWRSAAPAHCLEGEITFTPAFPDEWPEGEQPGGEVGDAYDLEAAKALEEECGAVGDT